MASTAGACDVRFLKEKHINFCLKCLQILPQRFDTLDSTRLIVAFFAVSGLDLLNSLDSIEDDRKKLIEWIYFLQVVPDKTGSNLTRCGFRGSTSCTVNIEANVIMTNVYDMAHIAMTYTALTTLVILGDDLSRINRNGIIMGLKNLQLPNGSFRPLESDSENDMRFIYCATCISYILQDWSGMDTRKAVNYIKNSITYEGAIAQGPGLEAHGGSTFCAVASIYLMGKLDSAFTVQQIERLRRWCLFRQQEGFQGRPNKPSDTCYTFWVGATLKLLEGYEYVESKNLAEFVLSTQDRITGGIARCADHPPDPLHTYLGISGLSLMELEGISPVHPALNISQRAVIRLQKLHQQWAACR